MVLSAWEILCHSGVWGQIQCCNIDNMGATVEKARTNARIMMGLFVTPASQWCIAQCST